MPDVLLLAPYPPPYGGVATHIQDLVTALDREGIRVGVANHYSSVPQHSSVVVALHRNPLRYWLTMSRAESPVLHYHHSTIATLLAAGVALKRGSKQIRVITIHNDYLYPLLQKPYKRWAIKWLLNSFDQVIAVNDAIGRQLEEVVASPVKVIPAFVEGGSRETLTSNSGDVVSGEVPTLIASAYEVDRTSASADLYGLDVTAKVFAKLRARRPIHLVIFISKRPRSRRDRHYLRKVLEVARRSGDSDDVRCLMGEPLRPVFSEPNVVYLRPTRTEGDAVSVREALADGTPVVASDVVRRPAEVASVPINDLSAWTRNIENAIMTASSSPLEPITANDAASGETLFSANDYVDLYRRWIQDAKGGSG